MEIIFNNSVITPTLFFHKSIKEFTKSIIQNFGSGQDFEKFKTVVYQRLKH